MTDNLDGKWKCISALLGGGTFQYKILSVMVKGKNYSSLVNNQKETGEITLNSDFTPKQMDVIINEGPNQGKTLPAIYDLKNKELTVCYNIIGSNRPAEFSSTKENGFLLLKFQKTSRFLFWS